MLVIYWKVVSFINYLSKISLKCSYRVFFLNLPITSKSKKSNFKISKKDWKKMRMNTNFCYLKKKKNTLFLKMQLFWSKRKFFCKIKIKFNNETYSGAAYLFCFSHFWYLEVRFFTLISDWQIYKVVGYMIKANVFRIKRKFC